MANFRKSMLTSALLVALMGCGEDCTPKKTYSVEFEELITDSSGFAQTQEGRNISVTFEGNSALEGAVIDYFNGNHFEVFITSHDDGARDSTISPQVTILPGGNDEDVTISLTESGFLWEEIQQIGSEERRERYEAAHDFSSWAADPEVFGYRGCRPWGEIQSDFRDIGVFLYDVSKAIVPYVGEISTIAQSGREMFDLIDSTNSEGPSFYDPEECEAFQTFIFGPEYDGEFANTWTPTFFIMANLCVETIPSDEIANNGIDDNCVNGIDEGSSPVGDDDDDDDDDDDTGLEDYLLFDDFTGSSVNTSNWPSSGWYGDDPIVSNSNLVYEGDISRSGVSSFYQDYTGDRLVFETELEASDHFQIELRYDSNESVIIGNFLNFDIENAFWVWCSNAVLYDGSPLSTTSTSRIRLEHRRGGDLDVQVNGSTLNLAFACESNPSDRVEINIEQQDDSSYNLGVDYILLREE